MNRVTLFNAKKRTTPEGKNQSGQLLAFWEINLLAHGGERCKRECSRPADELGSMGLLCLTAAVQRVGKKRGVRKIARATSFL